MTSQLIAIIIGLTLLAFQDNLSAALIVQSRGPIYFMMYIPLVLTVGSGLEFLINNRKPLFALVHATRYDPKAGA